MDCLSRTSAKSSVARKKFELAVKKKRLESDLELAKTKLKLDELKLISQAQEHLGDLEIQIEEVEQEMGVLSADELELSDNIRGSNTPEPLSPVMLRRFAFEPLPVAEPVPVAQPEFHPLPTPRSRKISACNSNISRASVRPDMTSDNRKYSTILYPRKFYQDNANQKQSENISTTMFQQQHDPNVSSANLTDVLNMFATSLNNVFSMPRRSMPQFSGDPLRFFEFTQTFDEVVAKYIRDSRSQLMALIDCCVGEPKELIQACAAIQSPDEGLSKAKSLLWQSYGQRHVIVQANLCKLSGPVLKGEERELRELANAMLCCGISLRAWGYAASLNSQELITTVLKRLPRHMQFQFHQACQIQLRKNQDITFEDLTAFVQEKASMASDFICKAISEERVKDNYRPRPKPRTHLNHHVHVAKTETLKSVNFQSTAGAIKSNSSCPLCNGNHPLRKCKQLIEKPVADRWTAIKGLLVKVCFNCLGVHHVARECASQRRCNTCNGSHHSLLHFDKENIGVKSDVGEACTGKNSTCASTQTPASRVRLKVLPVTVWNSVKTFCIDTYAFLDEGADTTLCSERLLSKLRISETSTRCFKLQTLNGNSNLARTVHTSLSVKGLNLSRSFDLNNVLAVPTLPDLSDSIRREMDVLNYSYLNGIKFAELNCKDIDLLIGADMQAIHQAYESRHGP